MKIITIKNKEYTLTSERLENSYEPIGTNGFHIELDGVVYFYYLNDTEINGIKPKDIDELVSILIN
jgi:hypothetical protein